MKYYSSMTLADYVAVNWSSMDQNLVNLIRLDIEENQVEFKQLKDENDEWEESFDDLLTEARQFGTQISESLHTYTFEKGSIEYLIADILQAVKFADFLQ